VSRSIQEHDATTALLHDIGADALCDSPSLPRRHLRLPDGIEQRRLAVVDVAHDRDHGRPRLEALRRLAIEAEQLGAGRDLDLRRLAFADLLGDRRVHRHRARLDAKAVGDDRGGVEVDLLVDVRHHAVLHQFLDDVDGLDVEVFGQLLDRKRRRQLNLTQRLGRLGLGWGGGRRELGANRRLLLGRQYRHRVTGGMALWAQEIEDVSRLDIEVSGELLNLDAACCRRYG